MGCLQPRSYAANARHIHLNDRACAALQIFAKMEWTVEAFADGDGNSRCARETNVPIEIICSERLFELANIEGLIRRALRIASSMEKAWLASVKISKAGPTADRTAANLSTSSLAGRPTLILEPPKPADFASSASATSASAGKCSQPPRSYRVALCRARRRP